MWASFVLLLDDKLHKDNNVHEGLMLTDDDNATRSVFPGLLLSRLVRTMELLSRAARPTQPPSPAAAAAAAAMAAAAAALSDDGGNEDGDDRDDDDDDNDDDNEGGDDSDDTGDIHGEEAV